MKTKEQHEALVEAVAKKLAFVAARAVCGTAYGAGHKSRKMAAKLADNGWPSFREDSKGLIEFIEGH